MKLRRLSKAQFIGLGFLMIILIGTLLLMLPLASRSGKPTGFVDALFTATSATCVTGLVVEDTYRYWSLFGQSVILVLIQIGGLGFMSVATFFSLLLKRRIGLKQRELLQESISSLRGSGLVKLAKRIIVGTIFFEGMGAILLAIRFCREMDSFKGIYFAIFHSVSAFCNAGFDLMGARQPYSSFTSYVGDPLVNLTLVALIIIGGIGFFVWDDIAKNGIKWKKYQLHTKIVLTATAFLVFFGTMMIYFMEKDLLFQNYTFGEKILASLFSSVTARTAGFNTVDTAALSSESRVITMVLMFIGGSPGSTAGGIKTTTVMVLVFYGIAGLRQKHYCNIFGRRLEQDTLRQANTVLISNVLLVLTAMLGIGRAQNVNFSALLFEVISALGTVGMSVGITREMLPMSRIILAILMYCGRIGSVTFALLYTQRRVEPKVKFPEEKIRIG